MYLNKKALLAGATFLLLASSCNHNLVKAEKANNIYAQHNQPEANEPKKTYSIDNEKLKELGSFTSEGFNTETAKEDIKTVISIYTHLYDLLKKENAKSINKKALEAIFKDKLSGKLKEAIELALKDATNYQDSSFENGGKDATNYQDNSFENGGITRFIIRAIYFSILVPKRVIEKRKKVDKAYIDNCISMLDYYCNDGEHRWFSIGKDSLESEVDKEKKKRELTPNLKQAIELMQDALRAVISESTPAS